MKIGKLILMGVVIAAVATTATALKVMNGDGDNARAKFEKFKSLAGEWTTMSSHGEGEKQESTARYHVTAGGTAVVETIFMGSPHEMVTVYHMDGDQLVLTHYCVLGNQPKMIAQPGGDASKVAFKFAGGSNITSKDAQHMHDASSDFVDNGHVVST